MTEKGALEAVKDAAKSTFGQRVRVAMAAADTNGNKIARQLGVSAAAVSKWANGQTLPSSKHLVEFCKLTGCSMDWITAPSNVDVKGVDPLGVSTAVVCMLERISEYYAEPDECVRWFRAPQPLIGGETPINLIAFGRERELYRVWDAMDAGAHL